MKLPSDPPIRHYFIVIVPEPLTEKRLIEQRAKWIQKQLATSHHDENITVQVVYE